MLDLIEISNMTEQFDGSFAAVLTQFDDSLMGV